MSSTLDAEMATALAGFLPRLRRHPGMYVPGRTYIAVTSFVAGYRWGADDESLSGFQSWLADRVGHRPELGWPSLVLCARYPADQLPDPRTFSDEQDAEAIETLFNLLEDYYESGKPSLRVAEGLVGRQDHALDLGHRD